MGLDWLIMIAKMSFVIAMSSVSGRVLKPQTLSYIFIFVAWKEVWFEEVKKEIIKIFSFGMILGHYFRTPH